MSPGERGRPKGALLLENRASEPLSNSVNQYPRDQGWVDGLAVEGILKQGCLFSPAALKAP